MQKAKTPNANILNPIDKCIEQQCLNDQSLQYQTTNIGNLTTNSYQAYQEELNNNLFERKNANNEIVCSPVRWTTTSTAQTMPTVNQVTTPIFLHHPPSFDDSTYTMNTTRSTNQLQQTVLEDESTNQLQLMHSREDQLQLHQLNEAEQRMERRLKQRSRLTSSDSTSTESTKEERLNKDLPYPEYVRYSFNWLPQDSEWRLICLRMIANPWFERVSMTAILINCITLGMYHPCADEICLRPKCRLLQMFDDIIFAFFALEMLIKMTAMGVRGTKSAYFSETWNRLDFFIVISGVPEYIVGVGNINLSTIRTFRILRPLKAVKVIPSLRLLVSLLADTLPMLSNVLLLCFFVFFIFGIIGVQLWAGLLRQRCFLELPPEFTVPLQREGISLGEYYVEKIRNIDPIASHYQLASESSDKEYICSLEKDNGMHRCSDLPPTKYGELECTATIEDYMEFVGYDKANEYTMASNQLSSSVSPSLSSPIINDTMSSINNFNTLFALKDNQTANCINWNRYYTKCKAGDKNPFQGTMSFDNVGMAWTAIFLVISLEGWTEIMYYVQDAHSFWDWLYFVLLIVIGSFFMINLCLVVIATQFSETKKREMERMRLERARYASSSSLGSNTNSEPTNCYNALLKYLAHLGRRAKRRLWRQYKQYRKRKRRSNQQSNTNQTCNSKTKRTIKSNNHSDHQLVKKSSSSSDNNKEKELQKNVPEDTCIELQPIEQLSASSDEIKNDQLICSARSNLDKQRPLISCLRTNRTEHICPISEQNVENHLSIQTSLSTSHSANVIFRDSMRATNFATLDDCNSSNLIVNTSSQRMNSNLTNLNCFPNVGSVAVLAAPANRRRHGSVPTLYLRPNRSDSNSNSTSNFLVSTLDGNYLTTAKNRNQLNNNLNKPQMQLNLVHNQPANTLHWSPRPTLIRSSESGQFEEENFKLGKYEDDSDDEVEREYEQWVNYIEQTCWYRAGAQVKRVLEIIVDHRYFQRFIFLSILINTLSMGAEYHNQPESLTSAVEWFNIIFTVVFLLEMILKIMAHGCYVYISDGFNVFDGIVVIVSVMEFMEKESGGSGLSVLRTFRLLRILKLVRFMPALKRQLVIMLRTLDNVAVFFLLLVLFIFIFSILGMNLFGCKFCSKMLDSSIQCDRKNFDSLLWALVTVFQVLTQEDWGIVLFNGMERTTHWAALYFVVLMTFGNYVLFNLLVAILVEGFSQEKTDVESLEDEEQEEKKEIKDEKLIYFYGPKDNLEHEIELLKNSPGIITKLQSPNSHLHHLELDQHAFDKLKAGEQIGSSSLAAAFAQAKLILPADKKEKTINRHLSNSMAELCTASSISQEEEKKVNQAEKGGKLRRNSIRQWVAGATHRKKYSATCKQLKESLSRESSIEKSDQTTSAKSFKKSSKITTSSSLLPQLSLKDDAFQSSSDSKQLKVEKKRRMSVFTDWKPLFSPPGSSLFSNVRQQTQESIEDQRKTRRSSQIGDDNQISDQFESSERTGQLNKLDEEIEEEDGGDGITELSSPLMSKRSSAVAIHEMKPLSPGTSLSGVFYCSSSVHSITNSNRKSSLSIQASSRTSINSTGDASMNSGQNQPKLQRRSTLSVGQCRRRNKLKEIGDQDRLSVEKEAKRRSVSSDLSADNSFRNSNFLTHHYQNTIQKQQLSIDNDVNQTLQPISIAQETIVEEIGQQRTNVPQHTAIDFNNTDQIDISNTNQPSADKLNTLTTTNTNLNINSGSRHSSCTSSSSKQRSTNSACHSTSLKADDPQRAQESLKTGSFDASTTTSPAKFCVYFRWYSWMTKRLDYSLFIFPPDNELRLKCIKITDHKCFDYIVLIFISLNCITLAMERPKIPPWSAEREILNAANYIFTFIFTLEMALKVIAKGFYYSSDAYLKSMWNKLDATLVGISLFDLFLTLVSQRSPRILGILRVFRLLRSLRPLRIINRAPGLKLVVQTLLSSLRPIGNIVLICCTFFVIFGILGVQLFKGALHYCEGPDVRYVRNKTDCLADERNHWINRKYNFDNLGQALMALFVLSSKDGWVNIMYTGLDAVGVDQQPQENYNEWRLLYFISFLLLVAFFVLNMFVGVVVENFHRCRQQQELEERARRAEKRARKLEKRRRKMRKPPYYTYYSKTRLFVHKLVTGKWFDVIISGVIGLNVITMSLEYYQMPQELINTLKLFNFVFTSVFIIEAIFKVYALGLGRYFRDKWNQLDVLIVVLSVVGIILEEMETKRKMFSTISVTKKGEKVRAKMEAKFLPINPTIIRVMRVARIARVLKLLKMAKGMRALLNTVMQALPQVGNLGLLFYLLFFIFAALGVELFGRLECDDDHPCQGLSEHAHFQNFGMAFLTLFRIATGDNWNGIMKDTLRDECDASSDCLRNCCVSPIIAPMYFVVFVLLAQFVLVNVVVAVLMKHLEESHRNMEEEEDYEIDMEIARELAAEKKALEDAADRRIREQQLRKCRFKMCKMNSLPPNFKFQFDKYLAIVDEPDARNDERQPIRNGINNSKNGREIRDLNSVEITCEQ